ncbi:unnamed protein product, partial [Ectocarpus sp. 8 AP-2014]
HDLSWTKTSWARQHMSWRDLDDIARHQLRSSPRRTGTRLQRTRRTSSSGR